jgi:hypothetical protein
MAETRRKFHPNDLMPNTTQVPNIFLDRVMPAATEAVFKLLMCVARQTYGWRKEWDAISITQLEKLTGLSNRSVIDNMAILRDAGLVVRRSGEKPEWGMEHALNLECDFDKAVVFLQQQRKQREPRIQPSGGRRKTKDAHEPCSSSGMNRLQGHEPLAGGKGFTASHEPGSPQPHEPGSGTETNYQNQLSKLTGEASFQPNGNGHKANSNAGLSARLEAIRQSRAEQKPLYRAERLLLPTETDEGLNATEVAWAVCGELGRRGDADRIAMEGAVVAYRVKFQDKSWEQCAEELMKAWSEYEEITRTLQLKPPECFGFRGFLDSSQYLKRESWPKGNSPGAGQPIGPSVAEQQRERRRAATVDRQRNEA